MPIWKERQAGQYGPDFQIAVSPVEVSRGFLLKKRCMKSFLRYFARK
jgi:hypothetical protein